MRLWLILLVSILIAGLLSSCQTASVGGQLVEYRRSGGFAGLSDHLTIANDGHATLTRRTGHVEFDLERASLDSLTTLLDNAELPKLRDEYFPPGQGADLIEYTITYKGRTVRTKDGAIPTALQPAISRLNQIVDTAR